MEKLSVQFRFTSIKQAEDGVEVTLQAEEEVEGMQLRGSLVLSVLSVEVMKLDHIRYGDRWRGVLMDPPWEE